MTVHRLEREPVRLHACSGMPCCSCRISSNDEIKGGAFLPLILSLGQITGRRCRHSSGRQVWIALLRVSGFDRKPPRRLARSGLSGPAYRIGRRSSSIVSALTNGQCLCAPTAIRTVRTCSHGFNDPVEFDFHWHWRNLATVSRVFFAECTDFARGIEGHVAHDNGLLIGKLRDDLAVAVGDF